MAISAYVDQSTLANDATYKVRVLLAALQYAGGTVVNEAHDGTVSNWQRRAHLANNVLTNPVVTNLAVLGLAYACTFNAAVQAGTTVTSGAVSAQTFTDAQLLAAVQSFWNALSGVSD